MHTYECHEKLYTFYSFVSIVMSTVEKLKTQEMLLNFEKSFPSFLHNIDEYLRWLLCMKLSFIDNFDNIKLYLTTQSMTCSLQFKLALD